MATVELRQAARCGGTGLYSKHSRGRGRRFLQVTNIKIGKTGKPSLLGHQPKLVKFSLSQSEIMVIEEKDVA